MHGARVPDVQLVEKVSENWVPKAEVLTSRQPHHIVHKERKDCLHYEDCRRDGNRGGEVGEMRGEEALRDEWHAHGERALHCEEHEEVAREERGGLQSDRERLARPRAKAPCADHETAAGREVEAVLEVREEQIVRDYRQQVEERNPHVVALHSTWHTDQRARHHHENKGVVEDTQEYG